MANYYLDLSHASVGKGNPHAQYILGQGNYEYKDKEVQYVSNNLPSWAENEVDFWTEGDDNERINGMVYKEIKLSLGDNHHYTAVIHDKESSYE